MASKSNQKSSSSSSSSSATSAASSSFPYNFPLSSSSSSSSSSSPSSLFRWKYDVFLSFRGQDTRKKFVSHLYKALDQKGIHTFKDDKTLQRGEEVTPEILKAIEESRFSIIVFSENYASSGWCLDELEKSLHCKNEFGQTVLPIFYEIDPSHLTDPAGGYAKALAIHEENRVRIDKVQRWKLALEKAADLSGWDSRNR